MDLNNTIQILSGEDEQGVIEIYTGKKTKRAIKTRLTKERCDGDRWAKALVYSHENEYGKVGIDFESGEFATWRDPE